MGRSILMIILVSLLQVAGTAQSIGPVQDKTGGRIYEMQEAVTFPEQGLMVVVVLDRPEDPAVATLRLFNTQEQLQAERQVTLSPQNLPAQVEGAFKWGDRLTLLTSVYYPGPRRNNLLLRQFSLPKLEEVAAIQVDEAYTPENQRIPFGYSLSPDSSLLLCHSWSYSLPADPVRLRLKAFGKDLRMAWNRDYVLPYQNEDFYLYGSLLDASGNAYLLCEEYLGKPSPYSGVDEQKIKQIILYAGAKLEQPRDFVVQPGKLILTGIRFALDPGGQLVGAGFYRERNTARNEGLITLRIDGAANQMQHHLIPVSKELYEQAWPAELGRPARVPFLNYSVDYLFVKDSSLILVSEQIEETNSYVNLSGGVYSAFKFNDLLVARIKNGRQLQWIRRLPKTQEGAWDDLPKFSYSGFMPGDSLYLIFNNLKVVSGQTIGGTHLIAVAPNGTFTQHAITAAVRRRQAMTPYPARAWAWGKDRVLIYGVRSNKDESFSIMTSLLWKDLLTENN